MTVLMLLGCTPTATTSWPIAVPLGLVAGLLLLSGRRPRPSRPSPRLTVVFGAPRDAGPRGRVSGPVSVEVVEPKDWQAGVGSGMR